MSTNRRNNASIPTIIPPSAMLSPTSTLTSNTYCRVASPPAAEQPPQSFVQDHALRSKGEGDSEVERVTRAIETRRKERVVITKDVRVALLQDCRAIAKDKKYKIRSKIHVQDLKEYRDLIQRNFRLQKRRPIFYLMNLLGVRNQNEQLLRVLERAYEVVQDQGADDPYFHFMDFNAYHTVVESRLPWRRHPLTTAVAYIFLFYLLTPLYFCLFLEDEGICPPDDDNSYSGWLGALYFASTTLSTVGYGDLSVDKTNGWHVFAGTVYMIAANLLLIGSFSTAVEVGFNPLANWGKRIADWVTGEVNMEEPLYVKLRRLKYLKLIELYGGFTILILIGVFANRFFLLNYGEGELTTEWTWMVSFYWAVQTATTIGYGDLDQPPNQRWFQIFYLVLSTYFVGTLLKGIVTLRDDMEQVQREYAWRRRDVNKNLIDEFQTEGHDGKVDQYEFVVASLVQLGKISSEDVIPIMNKYRSLAGEDGFITQQSQSALSDEEIQKTIDEEAAERIPFTNQLIATPSFVWRYFASQRGLGDLNSISEEDDYDGANNPTETVVEDIEDGTTKKRNQNVAIQRQAASSRRDQFDSETESQSGSGVFPTVALPDIIKMLAFETSAPTQTK